MPTRSVILKKGYLQKLIDNYEDCIYLEQLAKKADIHINTLKTGNKGLPISVNSINKIANHFNIQNYFIENSILTEEEAKQSLKKRKEVPSIMRKKNDQHN